MKNTATTVLLAGFISSEVVGDDHDNLSYNKDIFDTDTNVLYLDDFINKSDFNMSELVVRNTSSDVLSLLKPDRLDNKFCSDKLNDKNSLFPKEVQTIGIESMANGLLGNVKRGGLSVIQPPFVDIGWAERVYCAGTIKGFIGFSKNPNDRSRAENIYINKQGIDAWMLPDELRKIGFTQRSDLKNYFDLAKLGYPNIIKDKNKYKEGLLHTGNILKNDGVPGSVLFIYFNLSNYTWVVKGYNEERKLKNGKLPLNINTHQALFLGNSYMEFKASDIKNYEGGDFVEMNGEVDIVNFITNFIQQRGGYRSALNKLTRNTILDNLNFFHSLIEIEVNGKKINLGDELKKVEDNKFKISKNDDIKISGSILIDGFHDANSNNKYISENNHVRTMFYFEFITIGTHTPSELLVPPDKFLQSKVNTSIYDNLVDKLEVTNLYYLKRNENINLKLKEAILRFKFLKYRELEFTSEEISLMNEIDIYKKYYSKSNKLSIKLISLREDIINSLISSLSPQELYQFNNEYQNQIYGLQMMGYMQSEGEINPNTTNINAPIPYFESSNIKLVHSEYIENKKNDILNLFNKENIDLENDECVKIYFFPGDNFSKVFNQLYKKLELYTDKYPNFLKINNLDLFQKYKLTDLVIDKYNNNSNIDVTNGVIPSMKSINISLEFVNSVLDTILNESFIEEVENLSDIDRLIISSVSNSKQDYDILAHILAHESYELGLPKRKFMKIIGGFLGKTSSYGDFQLKLTNLNNKNESLVRWPNVEHIKKAISFLDNEELKVLIDRRVLRFEDNINKDIEIVEEIQEILEYIEYSTDNQRLEAGQKIYKLLTDLFRFNDTRQINIIGKIIQASLTLDKMHEHHHYLNGWLLNSGISIDEILYDDDLLERYKKLLLTINNRAEKNTLIGTSENYTLRVLDALGDDIKSEIYPKLKRDYKGHIEYNREVLIDRFSFYLERLSIIKNNNDDESIDELIDELTLELENLKEENFSALEIYKFFKNNKIKNFLNLSGHDSKLLPTNEEFHNTAFRELFFDYVKYPEGMKPPKIYDYQKIFGGIITTIGLSFLGIIGLIKKVRRKK